MGKTFRINMISLKADECLRVEHVLLCESTNNIPQRYYLAELPAIDDAIRFRLRIYENLVN